MVARDSSLFGAAASRSAPTARERSAETEAAGTRPPGPGLGAGTSRTVRWLGDREPPGTTVGRREGDLGLPVEPLPHPPAGDSAPVPGPPPPSGRLDSERPWALPPSVRTDAPRTAATSSDVPPERLPGGSPGESAPASGQTAHPATDRPGLAPGIWRTKPPRTDDGPARDRLDAPPADAGPVRSPEPDRPGTGTPHGTGATPLPPRAGARPPAAGPSAPPVPDLLELVREHVVPALVERGLIAPGARPAVRRADEEPSGPDVSPDRPTVVAGRLRISSVPESDPAWPQPGPGDVHVHIDRIEVHPSHPPAPSPPPQPPPSAPPPAPPPAAGPAAARPAAPHVDLDAYLAARRGERR
ncbi:hypothetical protein ACFV9D_24465 [Streptomyces sp. NPDC059875]|uniref:hypothetical protein n=1 Tax=unclassified Streptomyces TaxID=2593676 RepID=UPI0036651C1F